MTAGSERCGGRDRFVVPAAGFITNDDRSMREMSSINATVTKQPVVKPVLLPCTDSRRT